MGRRAKCYTVAFVSGAALDYETFTDEAKLRAALAKLDAQGKDACALFAGEPIHFEISREPTVQIGAKREPAARGRKPKAKAEAKGVTKVTPEFFEETNGSAEDKE